MEGNELLGGGLRSLSAFLVKFRDVWVETFRVSCKCMREKQWHGSKTKHNIVAYRKQHKRARDINMLAGGTLWNNTAQVRGRL